MRAAANPIRGLDARGQKKTRYLAEFCPTYGIPGGRGGRGLSYEDEFGLFLNIERIEKRWGFVAITAIISGLAGNIPKSFFEGVSHTDAEAEFAAQQYADKKAFYEGRSAQ